VSVEYQPAQHLLAIDRDTPAASVRTGVRFGTTTSEQMREMSHTLNERKGTDVRAARSPRSYRRIRR